MDTMFIQSTEAAAAEWCVVFDTRTGKAVHIHQVVSAGAREPASREELEREALEMAAARHPRETLRVAHPSRDVPLDPRLDYRIDPQSESVRTERVDLASRRRAGKTGGRSESKGG